MPFLCFFYFCNKKEDRMKGFVISLGTILCFATIIFSCGSRQGSPKEGPDSLSFDSIKADSTVHLGEDTASPQCHVSLTITYAKGKNADQINDSIIRSGILSPDYFSLTSNKLSVKQAVDSFVTRYLSEYKKDYGDMYKADKSHGASYNCEYIVKTKVLDESDEYYTYVADVYMYGGGAHGSTLVIAKNIDAKTGKIVALKDVFVPGYEKELNDLIVKSLCEKYNAKDIKGLNEQTIFMGIDVYAPENFIIGDDEITFIYSPDEIACHAAGEIRVVLKKSELEHILRK